MASLSRQQFRITMTDGVSYEVMTNNSDQIAYEQTRARRKWPQITEGGVVTWWTFIAWRASSREKLTEASYEAWSDLVADIDNITPEDDDGADPTPPIAEHV